jgi:fluoride exporter
LDTFGFLAVGLGAALGAWLRWAFSTWFNPLFPTLPMGTLASNIVGGYLIGVAVAYFGARTGLPPEGRLFVVTGFLGGLTTFSTFSAEAVSLLSHGEYGWAALHTLSHLAGSLLMTVLGIATFKWLQL